jgi:hypothetical protein
MRGFLQDVRKTWWMPAALLAFSPLLLAQGPLEQPAPAVPAEVIGPPLVAWSELQKPRPIPESVAIPDRDHRSSQALEADSAQSEPSFTGTIEARNGVYLLRASDSNFAQIKADEVRIYQIDDQEKARNYEGKSIRVAGSLDTTTNMLHVTKVEPISF